MTVKDASIKFKLEENKVRKRYNEKMILGATKKGRFIDIPDDTQLIPSKVEIQSFLFQIIKHKNSPNFVISRSLCPQLEDLQIVANYLYRKGYIGQYRGFDTADIFFNDVQLTDEGIEFLFGTELTNKFNNISIPLSISPAIKVGLINL